jgi:hypothetical protein
MGEKYQLAMSEKKAHFGLCPRDVLRTLAWLAFSTKKSRNLLPKILLCNEVIQSGTFELHLNYPNILNQSFTVSLSLSFSSSESGQQ